MENFNANGKRFKDEGTHACHLVFLLFLAHSACFQSLFHNLKETDWMQTRLMMLHRSIYRIRRQSDATFLNDTGRENDLLNRSFARSGCQGGNDDPWITQKILCILSSERQSSTDMNW